MPIVSGQRWSVINRYSTKVTKSANADTTVRQVSNANDANGANDPITIHNANGANDPIKGIEILYQEVQTQ
ncbi:hypothetical protein PIROE2DRAFT_18926 [Piromyces sp. E2]|nr:hypothetical protein PIROE2DRAFT_18926 [Piromyces sp. E2]|eukprot:OUM56468.1 hypothetical protein PIROE2DRAFT_18926 [Piromyces sp. E2]